MSAVAAIALFAALFALFGVLAVAGGRVRGCQSCPEGESERCGACPLRESPHGTEEVEIR